MATKDEALKMAIETLEAFEITGYCDETIQACKEALEQPTQEPYGWMFRYVFKNTDTCTDWKFTFTPVEPHPTIETKTVYTHPAPSWQGLSDDEIGNCFDEVMIVDEISSEFTPINFARAIEAKLKEKNHG